MIRYTTTSDSITAEQIGGFFVGWPNPPSPEAHLKLLHGSDYVVLAIDDETEQVIGFVTAISDGVLSAYIPLLEVLPAYQRQGVGTELMHRMLQQLSSLYMIDLLCDPDRQQFYRRLGMQPASGMVLRNYDRQSGTS